MISEKGLTGEHMPVKIRTFHENTEEDRKIGKVVLVHMLGRFCHLIFSKGDTMENRIVSFSHSAKKEILKAFNMEVDQVTGCLIEKNNPSKLVLSPDGDPVENTHFAGLKKGSLEVIKSDINSLIKLSDTLK